MSEVVVKVEELGKKFIIGSQRSGDLRQTLSGSLKNILRRGDRNRKEFWAIRDVNLEIKRGEVIGIIGSNGAGKSTLLKILSRITHPSTGRFEINGRVSSLLEVGTGFHNELTGSENIFLNGTILGMRRAEIKKKFDEIVSFSGIEDFIHTPVKHYSSGMRVRLAFSVAAHLEPEVLIIDEVLAVGDAAFQRKCLGKMDEVSKNEGRTILFVSHNMSAVEHLCDSAVWINKGRIHKYGQASHTIRAYLEARALASANEKMQIASGMVIKKFAMETEVDCFDKVNYEIVIASDGINRIFELALLVYSDFQERVGIIDLRHPDLPVISSIKNEVTIKGCIKSIPLVDGNYQLGMFISSDVFRGDVFDLKRLVVRSRASDYVPYSRKHRGHVEFEVDFTIE